MAMGGGLVAHNWNGMTLLDKVHRASGRAVVGIGMQVAVETKRLTHRISGNLARSVHVAPVGYNAEEADLAAVEEGQDLLMTMPPGTAAMVGPEAIIEVGSWLPYACVEWMGRRHPGLIEGLELGRRLSDRIVAQAMREEGL